LTPIGARSVTLANLSADNPGTRERLEEALNAV
jgi:hypothetical protein